jgi:hypothetical protein
MIILGQKHVNVTTPFCQCCGPVIFIPDPGYEIFHPGSRVQGLKDSRYLIRIRIAEFKHSTQKLFLISRNMIRNVHHGS